MTTSSLITIVEIVAVVAFVLYRQLRTRPVGAIINTLVLVLGGLGIYDLVAVVSNGVRVSVLQVLVTLIGLAVTLAMAWPRARSMRVWQDADGTWMRRGTALTLAWWIVSFALRFGVTVAARLLVPGVADSSALTMPLILVAVAASLALQNHLVAQRTRSADAAPAPQVQRDLARV